MRENFINISSGLLLIPAIPFAAAPFMQNNINDLNTINYIRKQEEKKAEEAINNMKDNR
jgi:filamentous hemagglutinin